MNLTLFHPPHLSNMKKHKYIHPKKVRKKSYEKSEKIGKNPKITDDPTFIPTFIPLSKLIQTHPKYTHTSKYTCQTRCNASYYSDRSYSSKASRIRRLTFQLSLVINFWTHPFHSPSLYTFFPHSHLFQHLTFTLSKTSYTLAFSFQVVSDLYSNLIQPSLHNLFIFLKKNFSKKTF